MTFLHACRVYDCVADTNAKTVKRLGVWKSWGTMNCNDPAWQAGLGIFVMMGFCIVDA